MEKLLNVAQVAELLDVPVSWVYQRTRKNDIPLYRVGKYVRFKASEVLNYYEEIGDGESLEAKSDLHPLHGNTVANVGETQTVSVSNVRTSQE